jgi:alkylation response protein AidB-like acyl-CoA dehydrogenase
VDLALSDEQSALVASIGDLLGTHSSPAGVRNAEETGFDGGLWASLREFGIIEMGVDEAVGGWGATLLDLCLTAEQIGAALAAVPVVEVQCAARLLSRLPEPASLLEAVLAGDCLVTLAVRPPTAGVLSLVPAAGVADRVIAYDGQRLISVGVDDENRTRVQNLASAPLADVRLDGLTELAIGTTAAKAFERALDEWLTLTAAALTGAATSAHRMTCEYATVRRTWDAAIGSYQGVAHPLADSATAIDGARLLVHKAAMALEHDDSRARELAAMAFAFATETARDATYQAVHLHGGVGFTLEHDAQLYYRRARGWARVWGEPRAAYRRAADARYGAA